MVSDCMLAASLSKPIQGPAQVGRVPTTRPEYMSYRKYWIFKESCNKGDRHNKLPVPRSACDCQYGILGYQPGNARTPQIFDIRYVIQRGAFQCVSMRGEIEFQGNAQKQVLK